MPYAQGRTYHDADSHVMETPDWLFPFADPDLRPRLALLRLQGVPESKTERFIEKLRADHGDPEYRAQDEAQIMLRKNWSATGSFLKHDRSRALDLLGFSSQLVFNTFLNAQLLQAEHGDDVDYAYGLARAHNRAMIDFCSVDRRLLATCYVPLRDFARARAMAAEAIAMGARALLVASACPKGHSPSHIALDPVWAQAQEAGIPIVMHVGGGGKLLDPHYFDNGLPAVPDFHGGAENFRSIDYMAIPADPGSRARSLSASEDRRDRARRVVAAELHAPARLGARRLHQDGGAVATTGAAAERIHHAPGARHALSDGRRRVHHRAGGRRGVPVLERLPARRRRPQPGQALRREPRAIARTRETALLH
jgi:hypothetical protein